MTLSAELPLLFPDQLFFPFCIILFCRTSLHHGSGKSQCGEGCSPLAPYAPALPRQAPSLGIYQGSSPLPHSPALSLRCAQRQLLKTSPAWPHCQTSGFGVCWQGWRSRAQGGCTQGRVHILREISCGLSIPWWQQVPAKRRLWFNPAKSRLSLCQDLLPPRGRQATRDLTENMVPTILGAAHTHTVRGSPSPDNCTL